MRKFYKNTFDKYIYGEDLSFDARLFNLLCLVGIIALFASLIGHIIVPSNWIIMIVKFVMLSSAFGLFVFCNKYKRHNFGRIVIIFGFCDIMFPLVFFTNGGSDSGIAAYFVLSMVLIIMLSRGVKLFIHLAIYLTIVVLCYLADLYRHDWIFQLNTFQMYADNIISIMIAGLFLGLIIIGLSSLYIYEKKKSDAASKAKGDFLAQMSHEMRTPLNAIIGMASILDNSDDLGQYKAGIKHIETASSHLLGVINDILDMSKIEADKFELNTEPFDFKLMLRNTVSVVNFNAEKKDISLVLDIDENIPENLYGDRQRLAQVVTNLLSNAIKFSRPDGKVDLKAELLRSNDKKHTLLVSVADTGIGINEEQQSRLFQSFEQADNSTSRKYGGTGLGLAISKRIVEAMDGRIWVESVFEEGSVFSFEVTLSDAENPPKKEVFDFSSNPADYDFSDKTILIVEDIDINREIIMTLLEPTGVRMKYAGNGIEAVKLFEENGDDLDLILMDIQMPEMDGNEATRTIRAIDAANAKTIPIIAMTANVFKDDIDRAKTAGMNDFLGKPVVIEDILAKLSYYFRKK